MTLYKQQSDHGQTYYREATHDEITEAAKGIAAIPPKPERLTVQKIVARIQNAVHEPHQRDMVEPLAWFLYDLLTRIETLEKQ